MKIVQRFLGRDFTLYYRALSNIKEGFIPLVVVGGYTNTDDRGGIYNFDNAIQCCAKVFAEGGDAFEYYLNESKDFKVYHHTNSTSLFLSPALSPIFIFP